MIMVHMTQMARKTRMTIMATKSTAMTTTATTNMRMTTTDMTTTTIPAPIRMLGLIRSMREFGLA